MAKQRIRSALALEIAKCDRLKFNEAVADGYYPCAPITAKGSSRLFTEDDLVGLFIFARLMERGMPPRFAGPLACEFRDAARLQENKTEDRLIHVRGRYSSHIFGASQYDPDHVKNGTLYPGLGTVIDTLEFHVGNIRKIIADGIEAWKSTIGPEDEEAE